MDGERAYFAGLSGLDESDFSVADHIVDAGLDVYPSRDYFVALSGLAPAASYSYSDHRRAVFAGGGGPDVTPPNPGSLASSNITSTTFDLTVSGASDAVGLHAQPYAFSTDNGLSWSAYQTSPVFNVTGKTPSTAYDCVHAVRDAALNVAAGTPIVVNTSAGGGSITGTFQGNATDETDAATYTFAAQPFGPAEANRRIVVLIRGRHGAGLTFNTVTIGGVAATKHVTDIDGTSTNETIVASAVVPTGTTGDVVVTVTGGNAVRCMITIWSITGGASALRSTATAAETDPTSLTLTTVADDFVVGGTASQGGNAVAWTGGTERDDTLFGGTLATAVDAVATGVSTVLSADFALAPSGAICGAGAAFGPA